MSSVISGKQLSTQLIIQVSDSEIRRVVWPDIRACHHSIASCALDRLGFLFPADAETLVKVSSVPWLNICFHRMAVAFEIWYSFMMELAVRQILNFRLLDAVIQMDALSSFRQLEASNIL